MPNVVMLFVEGIISYRHFRNFPRHDVLIATNRSFSADHDFSSQLLSASQGPRPVQSYRKRGQSGFVKSRKEAKNLIQLGFEPRT